MRFCGSGSMRRAGGPRPRSAPGSIAWSSISASTRSAVRPICRSPQPAIRPILQPIAGAALELRERDRHLAAAIDRLPARQRAAIVLTYQEGLGNAEAAAVLGTSVAGVETLLVRARQSLREAFGESDGA